VGEVGEEGEEYTFVEEKRRGEEMNTDHCVEATALYAEIFSLLAEHNIEQVKELVMAHGVRFLFESSLEDILAKQTESTTTSP
jgi:hypothetical protein